MRAAKRYEDAAPRVEKDTRWQAVKLLALPGTTLEVRSVPEAGLWVVLDRREPEKVLAGPMPVGAAKRWVRTQLRLGGV